MYIYVFCLYIYIHLEYIIDSIGILASQLLDSLVIMFVDNLRHGT